MTANQFHQLDRASRSKGHELTCVALTTKGGVDTGAAPEYFLTPIGGGETFSIGSPFDDVAEAISALG